MERNYFQMREYMTTGEAGRVLGIHRRSVHRWILAGELPAMRCGGKWWRVPRAAVLERLAAGTSPGRDREGSTQAMARGRLGPTSS